jgi:hypothetical protein
MRTLQNPNAASHLLARANQLIVCYCTSHCCSETWHSAAAVCGRTVKHAAAALTAPPSAALTALYTCFCSPRSTLHVHPQPSQRHGTKAAAPQWRATINPSAVTLPAAKALRRATASRGPHPDAPTPQPNLMPPNHHLTLLTFALPQPLSLSHNTPVFRTALCPSPFRSAHC